MEDAGGGGRNEGQEDIQAEEDGSVSIDTTDSSSSLSLVMSQSVDKRQEDDDEENEEERLDGLVERECESSFDGEGEEETMGTNVGDSVGGGRILFLR
jgi:hypothetical protein